MTFGEALLWFNDNVLYYPLLIILLLGAGIYFTIRTGWVQGLVGEGMRVVKEKTGDDEVSGLEALMVTVGSKVGTGNIIGVSTAICLGGYGAVFWMWITGLIGASSAFIEAALAQIYKRRDPDGGSYGGPSYYMQHALNSRALGVIFSIALILTFGVGFNALASFNLQSSFEVYEFYDPNLTPKIIGGILALLTAYCLFGGGKRIIAFCSKIVPIMGGAYVVIALLVLILNFRNIPSTFGKIFSDAFNFEAIFGGIAGSSLMFGVKRGLYANEAGIGSAPNAAANAKSSHPAKIGLVQMLSVFIVTFGICTATSLMTISSGLEATPELAGAPYVQEALYNTFGSFGHIFITAALVFFAFTTVLGNLYYVDSNLTYLKGSKPSQGFMTIYRIIASIVVFVGASAKMEMIWNLSDLFMGIMAIVNVPVILILGKQAVDCLNDYREQLKAGKDPVFRAADIGIDPNKVDYWK